MIDKLSNSSSSVIDFQVQPAKPVEKTQKAKEKLPEEHDKLQLPNKEKMEKIVTSMNEFLKTSNSHLKFEYHHELKEYYVTLVDDKTNEVIREIPSKKLLDMYAAMENYLGLLVDRKA